MAEDLMRYDLLAQEALRGVVRAALRKIMQDRPARRASLSSSPSTRAIRASVCRERLDERYPSEMTIVLQHQYWNLQVRETEFEVELSFDNIPEKLVVPFNAIKGFLDPSVQFGLQFETVKVEAGEGGRRRQAPSRRSPPSPNAETAAAKPRRPKVVSLDSFRKK